MKIKINKISLLFLCLGTMLLTACSSTATSPFKVTATCDSSNVNALLLPKTNYETPNPKLEYSVTLADKPRLAVVFKYNSKRQNIVYRKLTGKEEDNKHKGAYHWNCEGSKGNVDHLPYVILDETIKRFLNRHNEVNIKQITTIEVNQLRHFFGQTTQNQQESNKVATEQLNNTLSNKVLNISPEGYLPKQWRICSGSNCLTANTAWIKLNNPDTSSPIKQLNRLEFTTVLPTKNDNEDRKTYNINLPDLLDNPDLKYSLKGVDDTAETPENDSCGNSLIVEDGKSQRSWQCSPSANKFTLKIKSNDKTTSLKGVTVLAKDLKVRNLNQLLLPNQFIFKLETPEPSTYKSLTFCQADKLESCQASRWEPLKTNSTTQQIIFKGFKNTDWQHPIWLKLANKPDAKTACSTISLTNFLSLEPKRQTFAECKELDWRINKDWFGDYSKSLSKYESNQSNCKLVKQEALKCPEGIQSVILSNEQTGFKLYLKRQDDKWQLDKTTLMVQIVLDINQNFNAYLNTLAISDDANNNSFNECKKIEGDFSCELNLSTLGQHQLKINNANETLPIKLTKPRADNGVISSKITAQLSTLIEDLAFNVNYQQKVNEKIRYYTDDKCTSITHQDQAKIGQYYQITSPNHETFSSECKNITQDHLIINTQTNHSQSILSLKLPTLEAYYQYKIPETKIDGKKLNAENHQLPQGCELVNSSTAIKCLYSENSSKQRINVKYQYEGRKVYSKTISLKSGDETESFYYYHFTSSSQWQVLTVNNSAITNNIFESSKRLDSKTSVTLEKSSGQLTVDKAKLSLLKPNSIADIIAQQSFKIKTAFDEQTFENFKRKALYHRVYQQKNCTTEGVKYTGMSIRSTDQEMPDKQGKLGQSVELKLQGSDKSECINLSIEHLTKHNDEFAFQLHVQPVQPLKTNITHQSSQKTNSHYLAFIIDISRKAASYEDELIDQLSKLGGILPDYQISDYTIAIYLVNNVAQSINNQNSRQEINRYFSQDLTFLRSPSDLSSLMALPSIGKKKGNKIDMVYFIAADWQQQAMVKNTERYALKARLDELNLNANIRVFGHNASRACESVEQFFADIESIDKGCLPVQVVDITQQIQKYIDNKVN